MYFLYKAYNPNSYMRSFLIQTPGMRGRDWPWRC